MVMASRKNDMVLLGQGNGLFNSTAIEGDGLFTEDMFSSSKSLAEIGNVSIVRVEI